MTKLQRYEQIKKEIERTAKTPMGMFAEKTIPNDIAPRKPSKTYYDGLLQGEKNARKMVAHLFKLHLDYVPKKNPPTKNQLKALEKFRDFLNYEGDEQ